MSEQQQQGVEVIAEAGSSHDGLLSRAVELVHMAKQCGADGVKFQWFGDPETLASRRGLGAEYAETYRRYAMPAEWLPALRETARRHGLKFVLTVFQPEDARFVAEAADDIKVSSFEAEDEDVLAAVAEARQPGQRVIVSLGMAKSPDRAVALIGRDVWFLHCVSAYPAPMGDLNLQRIAVQGLSGFSDHSGQVGTGALAVAAGAKLIEVHYRLDATDAGNPDYGHSLAPSELAQYVAQVRTAARALGTGRDEAQPSERPFTKGRRRPKEPAEG